MKSPVFRRKPVQNMNLAPEERFGTDPARRLEISTHENVTVSYEAAGLGTRYVANLLDLVIIYTGIALIIAAVMAVFGKKIVEELGKLDFFEALNTTLTVIMVIYMALFLIQLIYFTLFELLMHGTTPGKKALGIRVISVTGEAPYFSQVLARNAMRFFHMLPGGKAIDGLAALFSTKYQRLGDYAAGTAVVKCRSGKSMAAALIASLEEARKNTEEAETNTYGAADGLKKKVKLQTAVLTGSGRPEFGPDYVAPGAFLSISENAVLGNYLQVRRSISARETYDRRMASFLLGRAGDDPKRKLDAKTLDKYLNDVYIYNSRCLETALSEQAGGDGR